MNFKQFIVLMLIILSACLKAQVIESINKTDNNGKKQGHWIKKYPIGHIQYDGYFKDDQPIGIFKRFFENDTLWSILVFSNDGKEADALIYHSNGYIASKGKFVNQLKDGKWLFYSERSEEYLMCEEEYLNNLKNGPSLKYYPDKTIAEKLNYSKDIRTGEWDQYFPNGNVCLKAYYHDGKLEGKFEVFFTDGKPEYVGQYKNDTRDGLWIIYNTDGTIKYNIEYVAGAAKNPDMYKKESDYLDSLEKNKGKISDPEKTGTLWE
jgi:antitoxin component YwqK of YwqJK toxin-antitoxin module